MIFFGEASLRHTITEYVEHHYRHERPHQGKDNLLLFPQHTSDPLPRDGPVVCRERVGGLLDNGKAWYTMKSIRQSERFEDGLAVFDHSNLVGVDLSGRKLAKFTSIESRFEQCCFNNCRIEDASFGSGGRMSEYIDCKFDGLRFGRGGGACRLTRCSFKNVDLRNWICNRTELIDCKFSGRISKAVFSAKVPEEFCAVLGRKRNEYRNNDFSDTDLVDLTFRAGVDLSQQVLPLGPEYLYVKDAGAALQQARSITELWPESEGRKTAAAILTALTDSFKDGQRQFFLRPNEWLTDDYLSAQGAKELFALLKGV
jgi:uncharacterized protein YjbI with pentapeptide repeats